MAEVTPILKSGDHEKANNKPANFIVADIVKVLRESRFESIFALSCV